MVNSRAPEIAIRPFIAAAFRASPHEQTRCIAVTKLVWTAVILNGSEASRQLKAVGHLKCIAGRCIKSFRAKKGFRANPLEPPCLWACYGKQYSKTSNNTLRKADILCTTDGSLAPE